MLQSALLAIPDGGVYPDNPPDGPPTSATEFIIDESTGFVILQWANGDAASYTQIGFNAAGYPTEPTNIWIVVAPGETSYETGMTNTGEWWVRHTRGGTPSAWVWCDNS